MAEDALDREVHVAIARAIREDGAIPTIAQVTTDLGRDVASVEAAFARLADAHVYIPRKGSFEIHAYDPFCVGPTDFRVQADGREWWAICGWDALGIPPALGVTGTVESRCGDCGDPIRVEVGTGGEAATSTGAVLHVGMPARSFWKDIYYT